MVIRMANDQRQTIRTGGLRVASVLAIFVRPPFGLPPLCPTRSSLAFLDFPTRDTSLDRLLDVRVVGVGIEETLLLNSFSNWSCLLSNSSAGWRSRSNIYNKYPKNKFLTRVSKTAFSSEEVLFASFTARRAA